MSAELLALDRELLASTPMLTLDATRTRASLPSEVVERSVHDDDDSVLRDAIARGTIAAVRAMLRAFPHNLFWDLDLLVATQAEHARRGGDAEQLLMRIAALQDLFGEGSPVRFRYTHDFVYGFDWAKWVAKAPAERARVGPFDPAFVEHMHRRAHELTVAIATGRDAKYPPLSDGRNRNPFGFSREPDDEIALHRALAAAHALPVEAWRIDATPRWDHDFAARRRTVAADLGLHTSSSS